MDTNAEGQLPSGCEEFDRALALLADARDDEALDWFEVASTSAADAAVRASACAFAGAILLSRGRPYEVPAWADLIRFNDGNADLATMLEASALIQLDDIDAAAALLDGIAAPSDPWFPCSSTSVKILRAHVNYRLERVEEARREVMEAFEADRYSPDVWDAFARFCAETDFDPTDVVALVPDDRTLEVLAAMRTSEPAGVSRIAELIWARNPGDARVLALVPSFAARLDALESMEWSARMRSAGMGRLCPLLARADDVSVPARERARCAALAYATFGDTRSRESLELAVRALDEDELDPVLTEVWTIAPGLADSVVVAAATSSRRSLRLAVGLFEGGASDEAYAVLVHGLSMEDAATLSTEDVVAILPVTMLETMARSAEERGEDDVAGILEAVAVVAATQE